MSLEVCTNPECLTQYEPNKLGAVKDYCARCYRYSRRHHGALPGAKGSSPETRKLTVRVPLDLESRVGKLSPLPVATWIRQVCEARLKELELDKRMTWKGRGANGTDE